MITNTVSASEVRSRGIWSIKVWPADVYKHEKATRVSYDIDKKNII